MISFLFKPLIPFMMRRLIGFLMAAVGRDLRQRLPEVFELIDAEVVPAIDRGRSYVMLLFFSAVQRIVQRDPSPLEMQVLQLLFDPAILAARLKQPAAGS